jgi:pSer/pThr/pTyr-binding forkhead associated (FHA) protein
MPARLVAVEDGHTILIDKPILLIGRHPECDVQLESRKISRRHCCIAQVEDYLVVRDLESTNGIRINDQLTLSGKLQEGDTLTIGNLRYQVTWKDPSPSKELRRPPDSAKPLVARPKTSSQPALSIDKLMSVDMPVPLKEPGKKANGSPGSRGSAGDLKKSESRKKAEAGSWGD